MTHLSDIPGDYQYRALYHGNPVQRLWHKAKLELIGEVALPEPGERILDAACGSGVISDFLASSGAAVTGVDLNAEAIRFAKRQFERPGLRFECMSLFEFAGGPFDRIYCLEAIEHFPEIEVAGLLIRFSRLAAPGARLFLTTPNYASLWPLIEWALDFFELVPRLKGEQHLSKMTPFLLKKIMEKGGWDVIEIGSLNGIAPFAAILPGPISPLLLRWEMRNRRKTRRNLLYAVGELREI